jgi:AcrR family transcriptional regulator
LSIDAIVQTAIELADAEGLGAVSMARVAKELGFTTMSLYRYVTTKDELLQLMWNASPEDVEDMVLEGDGWRPKLRMWAVMQRQVLDRHPWLTQMPMATPPLAPNSLTFVERGLETLEGTPLAERDKLRVIGLISSYTLSEARMAHEAVQAAKTAPGGEATPPWDFDELLRELVDEQRYPRLYRIAWAAENSGVPPALEEQQNYLFGLERILDGVEAFMDRGAGQPS